MTDPQPDPTERIARAARDIAASFVAAHRDPAPAEHVARSLYRAHETYHGVTRRQACPYCPRPVRVEDSGLRIAARWVSHIDPLED